MTGLALAGHLQHDAQGTLCDTKFGLFNEKEDDQIFLYTKHVQISILWKKSRSSQE